MARRFRQREVHEGTSRSRGDHGSRRDGLVRAIDGIVWEAEPSTLRYLFVSDQAERILGFPAEAWLDDPGFWVEHVLPADRERAERARRRAVESARNHRLEYRMRHADGHVVWLRDVASVVVERGRTRRLCGVILDVSDQQEADSELRRASVEMESRIGRRTFELSRANAELRREIAEHESDLRALRDSERRFRMLAENIRQVFWMSTPGVDRMVYVSPAYEEIWGRPLARVMHDPLAWTEAIHPEDRPRVMREVRTHAEGRYEVDYRIIRPDGSVRLIHDRGFPVRDDDGTLLYMTGLAEDVTERRAADDAARLRDLAAHLQAAREEERTRIARGIHDELGDVLSGLKLEAEWAARRVMDDPGRVRDGLHDLVDTIDDGIASLRAIVSDLRPSALDSSLSDALRWQAGEFERLTRIGCSLELPDDEPELGEEASTALFRIAQEALTNVARHSGARWVRIELRELGGSLRLRIVDDGRGISDEERSGGGAFGLLGMQERARLVGAGVEVDGSPGEGTTVTVTLPLGG